GAPEGLQLDLADTLAGEAEPAADLLERLRLGIVQPVPEDQNLALAVRERHQGRGERLRTERDLDLFLRQRIVPRDEIAEHRVLLLADGLIERRGRARGGTNLVRLLDRERRFLGDLVERRLASELRPERALGAVHLLQALDAVD